MESKFKSDLLFLPLDQIEISKTNPRDITDDDEQKALLEIIESVKEKGVLQPILVRPMNGKFELVCGERRFRASTIAGFQDIPSNIRDLTDEEAFEVQIIENLQRKDVHPIKEAEAFRQMLESSRYSIHDIAAKVGKPDTFVTQRLKLNDLIPDIKKDFLHNELSIGHAIQIARLDAENQENIFKHYKDSYNISGYGTQKQLQGTIEKTSQDLTAARFPLDKDFQHAKACIGCVHRSSTNPQLFPDMLGQDSCYKKFCFEAKAQAHIEDMAMKILTTGPNVFLANGYGGPNKNVAAAAAKVSVPVLTPNTDYKHSKDAGLEKRKVFFVSGNEAGNYGDVWVKKESLAPEGSEESINAEIAKIETRAKRMLELDEEKVHSAIKEAIKKDINANHGDGYQFTDEMINDLIFYFAIDNYGLTAAMFFFKDIGIKLNTTGESFESVLEQLKAIPMEARHKFIASLMYRSTWNSTSSKNFDGQMMLLLANANENIPVKDIEAAQTAEAATRINRTKEKLKALRRQENKQQKPAS